MGFLGVFIQNRSPQGGRGFFSLFEGESAICRFFSVFFFIFQKGIFSFFHDAGPFLTKLKTLLPACGKHFWGIFLILFLFFCASRKNGLTASDFAASQQSLLRKLLRLRRNCLTASTFLVLFIFILFLFFLFSRFARKSGDGKGGKIFYIFILFFFFSYFFLGVGKVVKFY